MAKFEMKLINPKVSIKQIGKKVIQVICPVCDSKTNYAKVSPKTMSGKIICYWCKAELEWTDEENKFEKINLKRG